MNEPLDPPDEPEDERRVLESMVHLSQNGIRKLKREVGPMLIELENLYHRTLQPDKAQSVRRYRIKMNTEFPKP